MGKAFVAKLAKQGARDPEALAAWIGRKKHGKAAFQKLAKKGSSKGDDTSTSASRGGMTGAERKTMAGIRKESAAARARKDAKQTAAPQKVEPRDTNRGFNPADKQLPMQRRRLAVPDDERGLTRSQISVLGMQADSYEAAGATDAANRARQEAKEKEQALADSDYARETVEGDRAYGQSSQAPRKAANEAIAKARTSNDPADWEAAAKASDAFSGQAAQSPYGNFDAGWYRDEAKRARDSATSAREHRKRMEARKAERTLPGPASGERPVAHAEFLDSDGTRSFGDAELGRKVISRGRDATAMSDTGAEGHDSALKNVSPAFRKKVAEARASDRAWLHHVSHDSSGAEIHELQTVGPDGKPVKTTFLERNSKQWKAKEQQRRAAL